MTTEAFHRSALGFLDLLFVDFVKHKISLEPHWDIDHLCYRVANQNRYQDLKKEWASFSDLLTETEVNGRPIATFKLKTPLSFQGWKIDVIELPAPKPGTSRVEGFEHIEVVSDLSFAKLEDRYRHLKLNRSGLKKSFNPELEVFLGARNLKFHSMSLESVVRVESNAKAWSALKESRLLEILKPEGVLVVGAIPLGLETEDSPLELVVRSRDFEKLVAKIKAENFSIQSEIESHEGLDRLMIRLEHKAFKFKILAQDREPTEQEAYRYFLIEEKLIKKGGTPLRDKIMVLRNHRIPLEKAFAQVLGLAPEEALLELGI